MWMIEDVPSFSIAKDNPIMVCLPESMKAAKQNMKWEYRTKWSKMQTDKYGLDHWSHLLEAS